MDESTTKEILHTLHRGAKKPTSASVLGLMWEYVTLVEVQTTSASCKGN
jgi:hypothetical protein